MKIASYNINGVNGRLPVLLRWLQEAEPDIVCLQELKVANAKFPVAAIQAAGYGAVWHGQKSWNGVAILAKGVEGPQAARALREAAEGIRAVDSHPVCLKRAKTHHLTRTHTWPSSP